MLHKFLLNAKFHQLLTRMDEQLADETRQKGCPHCGEKLNNSDYPRSPFGVATPFRDYYQIRRSLCCAKCRKRTTPPSVRFFGRRWYCAPIFLLISALIGKPTGRRFAAIQRHLGLPNFSKKTWDRWRLWWHEYFPLHPFWKKMKGLIPIDALQGPLPVSVLAIFSGRLEKRIIRALKFFSPMTVSIFRAI